MQTNQIAVYLLSKHNLYTREASFTKNVYSGPQFVKNTTYVYA